MTNKEEKTKQQLQEKIAGQKETKDGIHQHVTAMKTITESFIALLSAKEPFAEEDLDAAFALNDSFEEHCQEITALLFELRDKL